VHDPSGALVSEAIVILRHEGLGADRVIVATRGAYAAGDLAPGEYVVTATAPGFAVATQRIRLAEGTARELGFTLRVGALTEDVVVHAAEIAGSHEVLRRLPGAVTIIDRGTLERSRVFTTSEALRKVPGVHVRDEEGFGLRPNIGIRGIGPTRSTKVLLLEDGIPLTYAPYGDNASYYHPPIDRFERVEVMTGGAQIAYGPQTLAGLVNFVTPAPPETPSGSFLLSGGTRGYFNGQGSYGATIGRTGFLLDVRRKQGDGAREHVHTGVNDLNAKVVRRTGTAQTWTFRGNYYSEDSTVTYSGLRQDEYEAAPRGNPFSNDTFDVDRVGLSATHGWAVSGNAALTTNVYYSLFTRNWWRQSSNSAQRPNDPTCGGMANLHTTCGTQGRLRRYHTAGVEPRMRVHHRALGAASEADFGVRLHVERQHRRQENGDFPTARSGELVEHNLRDNTALATFVQNRFLLGDLTITPGVRLEHVRYRRTNRLAGDATGETAITQLVPGLGISHAAHARLTWFTGVHRGFAPPRTEDIVSNTGGVIDLDPELSWNYEAGVRAAVVPGARVDATAFVLDYENQIVPASLAGGVGATLTNGGATLQRGLELAARLDSAAMRTSAHNVYVRAAYTWVPVARFTGVRFSSVSGSGDLSVTGNRLPYAPERLATVGAGYAHPAGLDAFVETVHTSRQFGDDLNTLDGTPDGQRGQLPAYTVWNATVNYGLRRATIFVTVKNVLDTLYIADRSRGILPGSPRLLQAGLRVHF
jgi:Fe(3+) dicitrate transport protein